MTGIRVPGTPVVDLGGEPSAVTAAVRDACAEVGFLQITGHGVDPGVVDQAWRAARAFFDLPTTDKLAAARRAPADAYGYIPLEVEALNRSLDDSAAPADLKETFNMGPPVLPSRALADDGERWAFAPTATSHRCPVNCGPVHIPTTARSRCCCRTMRPAGSRCSTRAPSSGRRYPRYPVRSW